MNYERSSAVVLALGRSCNATLCPAEIPPSGRQSSTIIPRLQLYINAMLHLLWEAQTSLSLAVIRYITGSQVTSAMQTTKASFQIYISQAPARLLSSWRTLCHRSLHASLQLRQRQKAYACRLLKMGSIQKSSSCVSLWPFTLHGDREMWSSFWTECWQKCSRKWTLGLQILLTNTSHCKSLQ